MWQKVGSDDPLRNVRSVFRWRGGYVALGQIMPSGQTSRTPVWSSTDGVTWDPLSSSVFGPTTLVIGLAETKGGLVALTLEGGANQCNDGDPAIDCWAPALPLRAWTSSDGTTWTSHPGPAIDLPVACSTCGVDVPLIRSGAPGVLVLNQNQGTQRDLALAAFSVDGITWTNIDSKVFPSSFSFGDVEAFHGGFIAVGDTGGLAGRAVALSSADGRHWVSTYLSTAGLSRDAGSTAHRIVVGPRGVIVVGSNQAAPSTTFWWTSTSGHAWRRFSGYPPLGVWNGEGEGTGLMPNGTLVGNGERLLAYRGGAKPRAWASFDGRSWRSLAISRTRPPATASWTWLEPIVLPIGLILVGPDGSVWFGRPTT